MEIGDWFRKVGDGVRAPGGFSFEARSRGRRGFREELLDAPCSRLSIVRFDTGPKRSMGHLLGAEKGNFLIRAGRADMGQGGPAGLILSIPAQEVSLGSPRVCTIHVQAPTPHTPPLRAFSTEFSQQATPF